MPEQTPVAYARISQPFGLAPPVVHCPICGQPQAVADAQGFLESSPCPHNAFIYLDEVSEFEHQSAEFANRLAELRKAGLLKDPDATESEDDAEVDLCDNIWLPDLPRALEQMGYGAELVVFEITYGGMACGPVWSTDVYGFDYDTLGESEDEA